jgi:hypothetical protein
VRSRIRKKVNILNEGQRKLRGRLGKVNLGSGEAFYIETMLLRLGRAIDVWLDRYDALELAGATVTVPSEREIQKLRDGIQAIREIIVDNETARGIMKAITDAGGRIPSPGNPD